jgi:hypothetical protein
MSKEDLIKMVLAMTPVTPVSEKAVSNAPESGVRRPRYEEGVDSGLGVESLFDDVETPRRILFDGLTLTPEHLVAIGYDTSIEVDLSPLAWTRVRRSRQIVDNIVVRPLTHLRHSSPVFRVSIDHFLT